MELELTNTTSLPDAKKDSHKQELILPADIELYTLFERFWNCIFGCNHAWGFPFHNREIRYPRPYDTHQNCNKCGQMRFYRFKGIDCVPGPLFKKVISNRRVCD